MTEGVEGEEGDEKAQTKTGVERRLCGESPVGLTGTRDVVN